METSVQQPSDKAWNNFVMSTEPSDFGQGDPKRAAAIASLFMGLANSGGLNSFLTSTWELDSQDFLEALVAVGALEAARQLGTVLRGLGTPLRPSSQDERWDLLDQLWTDKLDEHDVLSEEADDELMRVLARHVKENEAFYFALGDGSLGARFVQPGDLTGR